MGNIRPANILAFQFPLTQIPTYYYYVDSYPHTNNHENIYTFCDCGLHIGLLELPW